MPTRYPPPPTPYGYGPSYDSGNTIRDLILQRGQIAAQGAQNSAGIWGNALQGIGQTLSAGFTAHAEEQKKKQEIAKLAVRDAAFAREVESWDGKDPNQLLSRLTMFPPDERLKKAEAIVSFRNLSENSQEKEVKAIASEAARMSDPLLERWGLGMQKKMAPWLARRYGGTVDDYMQPIAPAQLREVARSISGERPAQFNLGPGESRFEEGNATPIASVAPKPPEAPNLQHVETAAGIQSFNPRTGELGPVIARGRPAASANGDNEPLMAVIDPTTGRPVYRRRSQAEGLAPASTREQGRPVTSGDAGRVAELDTSLDDLNVLRATVSGNRATGTSAAIGAAMPNVLTDLFGWGVEPKQKQAVIDRVKQVIGKALEDGVLRKEDEKKYEKILPVISDAPAVVETKLAGLEAAITQRRQRTLESLADAGYDTANFNARPPRGPLAPIPPGATPGGRPAAPPIIQRDTQTGAYRHSLDGGRTWIAGQP